MINYFKNQTPVFQSVVIITLLGLVLSLYNMLVPIYLDEAYYWVWSITPELSYYDHPAMVAWIMYPFSLIGTNPYITRLATVICMSITLYYLFRLTLYIAGEKPAWITLLIFAIIPVTHMGYVFITPDSPLMMFWTAGMYYTWLAINEGKTKDFIISGFLTGCMMLSKYTGILFPLSVFIFLLIRRRDLFKDIRLWITVLIAALCTFPIFYWNAIHDWISIAYQYKHGTSDGFTFAGWDFILFILGSFIIPTPILSFILIRYISKKVLWFKDNSKLYLVVLTLFPMFFFFYKGFFKKMELNWIIPAFLAGAVLMGIGAVELKMKKTLKYGCIFAIFLTIILRLAPVLPFPPKLNIADRLLGYDEVCHHVADIIKEDEVIFSDHLATASMLRYYIDDHRRVYIPVSTGFSQYTIWDNLPDSKMLQSNGLYVGREDAYCELIEVFEEVEFIEHYISKPKNATEKEFFIYRVYNKL